MMDINMPKMSGIEAMEKSWVNIKKYLLSLILHTAATRIILCPGQRMLILSSPLI